MARPGTSPLRKKRKSTTCHINVGLDKELFAYLTQTATDEGMTISEVTRIALRAYFMSTTNPIDSGAREGFLRGYRDIFSAVKRAISEIDPARQG